MYNGFFPMWFCCNRKWLYLLCRGVEHEPVADRLLPKSIGCGKNFTGKECLDTKEKVNFRQLVLLKAQSFITTYKLCTRTAKRHFIGLTTKPSSTLICACS